MDWKWPLNLLRPHSALLMIQSYNYSTVHQIKIIILQKLVQTSQDFHSRVLRLLTIGACSFSKQGPGEVLVILPVALIQRTSE